MQMLTDAVLGWRTVYHASSWTWMRCARAVSRRLTTDNICQITTAQLLLLPTLFPLLSAGSIRTNDLPSNSWLLRRCKKPGSGANGRRESERPPTRPNFGFPPTVRTARQFQETPTPTLPTSASASASASVSEKDRQLPPSPTSHRRPVRTTSKSSVLLSLHLTRRDKETTCLLRWNKAAYIRATPSHVRSLRYTC
ncbi:hypothetical protein K402DRAFT_268018 [Aulographum hederae CBS 113979]|uniref:Uncharacterized protein n=1 Tax=Aulographum hederae CBS 113979 TaxID=1176131 RepID=A0A6G1H866_9PEZI|nr:hypothetical protein K402DRAFT_268018 [Aulographum hederae CBS 113979]